MNKVFCLILLALGIFLAGCTYHVEPSIRSVDPALLPDFKGDHAVCVVNISPATGETILGVVKAGDAFGEDLRHTLMGDLHKWTNTAVALLQLELQKRGFIMRDGGEDTKVIKLAIRSAHIEAYDMTIICYVALHLETGNGYSRNYVTCNSGLDYDRMSDGALTKAVTDILNDKNVIEYLQTTN